MKTVINKAQFNHIVLTNPRRAFILAYDLEKAGRLEFFMKSVNDAGVLEYHIFYYNYKLI